MRSSRRTSNHTERLLPHICIYVYMYMHKSLPSETHVRSLLLFYACISDLRDVLTLRGYSGEHSRDTVQHVLCSPDCSHAAAQLGMANAASAWPLRPLNLRGWSSLSSVTKLSGGQRPRDATWGRAEDCATLLMHFPRTCKPSSAKGHMHSFEYAPGCFLHTTHPVLRVGLAVPQSSSRLRRSSSFSYGSTVRASCETSM